MIAKGNQRGGGQCLAGHLLNAQENEQVTVLGISGAVAQDLHGALAEWHAVAKGTMCRKYLYSLSVNPDPAQGELSREQYMDFIARTENSLGLEGQPKAVVFHEKYGREHCHIVWSRIDLENMKAVHLDFDRQKLRSVCREFARDHGLTLPEGMEQDGAEDRFNKNDKFSEKAQEDRSGISREERMQQITTAYQQSDTGTSFVHALEDAGYILAKGDKKNTYVVVDRICDVHGLSRQIKGVRKKDIYKRLEDYPLHSLADTQQAKNMMAAQQAKQQRKGDVASTFQKAADERHLALQQKQTARQTVLEAKKQSLLKKQHKQKQALIDNQKEARHKIKVLRQARKPKGLAAFLRRVTGVQKIIAWKYAREDVLKAVDDRQTRLTLVQRHKVQRMDLDRHFRADTKQVALEKRSLNRLLNKEQNQALHAKKIQEKPKAEKTKSNDARARAIKKVREAKQRALNQRKDMGYER